MWPLVSGHTAFLVRSVLLKKQTIPRKYWIGTSNTRPACAVICFIKSKKNKNKNTPHTSPHGNSQSHSCFIIAYNGHDGHGDSRPPAASVRQMWQWAVLVGQRKCTSSISFSFFKMQDMSRWAGDGWWPNRCDPPRGNQKRGGVRGPGPAVPTHSEHTHPDPLAKINKTKQNKARDRNPQTY